MTATTAPTGTADETTDLPGETTSTTTDPSTSTSSTSTTSTSTTIDPSEPGESTTPASTTTLATEGDGTTMPDTCPDACGPCQTCLDGRCVTAEQGTPCNVDAAACATIVKGLIDNTCHAAAPGPASCDGAGVCKYACNQLGPPIAACGSASCVKTPNPCIPDAPAANVTLGSLCALNDTTVECHTTCEAGVESMNSCDNAGTCMGANKVCEPYVCDPDLGACSTFCDNFLQCAIGHMCINNKCT